MSYADHEKRREVFRRWYHGGDPPETTALQEYAVMTQTEVAAALGISRYAVDRAERSAFAKLRRNGRIRALWADLRTP